MTLRFAAVALAVALGGCAAVFAAERPEIRGEWIQGGLIVGYVQAGAAVKFNGRPLRVASDGSFVVGLDRDEKSPAVLEVRFPEGVDGRYEFPVQPREYQIQRVDGLPDTKVNPPASALPRIKRDQKLAKAARLRETEGTSYTETFLWPCFGRISGVYGSQRILNGTPKQPHYGVDVAVPVGTQVHAPAGGVVSLAQPDMYYSGGTLMLDHGHGLSSSFMHLSKLLVKVGETVKRGDVIALSGATGRASGPHLHWGMSWLDARIDAQRLAGAMPEPEKEKETNASKKK